MTTMYLIGTGPSELHAHIDLDRARGRALDGAEAFVVSTAHEGGHWSVVAEIRPDKAGEGQ
ncbi:hypothetical protein AB0P13_22160 [Rhodococcus pyridinivorans]|uniref:hypothetical protein n=1 Tax=Mycobacteriales TaxID=85007 RepID=UPI0015FBD98E|nr:MULTISPECIES: hypothetical protein [unclassified Dietzia]MBB1040093.1 hypothetical protein [Dietzia sp. Cai40]MBB1045284.1 hypothetical protein [Dietzia sp. DQ11-44]